jgi:hypothetical protein
MRTATILAATALLAACGVKPEPVVRTVTVTVPVAVDCVPATLGAVPAYPDTDEALRSSPDAAERYRLLFLGRLLRDARLGEVEPVIQSCRKEAQ